MFPKILRDYQSKLHRTWKLFFQCLNMSHIVISIHYFYLEIDKLYDRLIGVMKFNFHWLRIWGLRILMQSEWLVIQQQFWNRRHSVSDRKTANYKRNSIARQSLYIHSYYRRELFFAERILALAWSLLYSVMSNGEF